MRAPRPARNLTGELQLHFQERLGRREVFVSRIEEISPHYRRIVFSGADLAEGYPFVPFAPSDHVKVYFPDPLSGVLVSYRLAGLDDDGEERWELDGEGEPIRRDYTPRAWDAEAGELTLDFVLHDHGVAGRWALRAVIGDRLVIMGPRANWLLPENYAHYVGVGDETAIPAISRLLEEAPPEATVTVFLEIANSLERQDLSAGTNRRVHWIERDSATAGEGGGSALETALRQWPLPHDQSSVFVLAAGEAGMMKPIRRYFRQELGLSQHQVSVDGYWKRGTTDFDHHKPDDHTA